MTLNDSSITRFLRAFERLGKGEDVPAQIAQFGETFLAAGPQGAFCVRAADFALALPKRKQLFKSLGHTATELLRVDETALDARYVLARTQWKFTFRKRENALTWNDNEPGRGVQESGKQEVIVDSAFVIDTGLSETGPGNSGRAGTGEADKDGADFKIVLYLSSQDVVQIVKERWAGAA